MILTRSQDTHRDVMDYNLERSNQSKRRPAARGCADAGSIHCRLARAFATVYLAGTDTPSRITAYIADAGLESRNCSID